MSGLIARLIEAGTPANLIEEVAMALARAQAIEELIETRRAKDRDRKRLPRNSTESEESAEIQEFPETPFLEVSPPPPFPKPIQEAPLISPRKKAKRTASVFPTPPDWMPFEPWAAFCALRHGMHPKVPWTPDACQRVIAKVDRARTDGHCPTKLLDKAVENSHRTVFPGEETKAPASNVQQLRPMTPDELRRAIQFNEDQGNKEKAAAYRFQLQARQSLAGGSP